MSRRIQVGLTLFLWCFTCTGGCDRDPAKRLGERLPRLDATLALHLVNDTPEEFSDFGAGLGWTRLVGAYSALYGSMDVTSPETFGTDLGAYGSALENLGAALRAHHQTPGVLESLRALQALPVSHAQDVLRRIRLAQSRTSETPTRQLARDLEALAEEAYTLGIVDQSLSLLRLAARAHQGAGDPDQERAVRRRALDRARLHGLPDMVAHFLGEQSEMEWVSGSRDEAKRLLHEAYAVAEQAAIPYQMSRALSFLADCHRREGRIGLAEIYYREARSVAGRYPGKAHEIRPAIEQMDFYCSLGLPEMALDVSDEIEILFRQSRNELSPNEGWLRLHWTRTRGRALFAMGRVEEAAAIYEPIVFQDESFEMSLHVSQALEEWIHGYLVNGRHREVLDLVARALDRFHGLNQHTTCRRLLLAEARARLALGDREGALAAWKRHRDHGHLEGEPQVIDWVQAAVVEIACAAASGSEELPAVLARTLGRCSALLLSGPGSTDLDRLSVAWLDPIRSLVHDLLADKPRLGLEFELTWRELAGRAEATSDLEAAANSPTSVEDVVRAWIDSRRSNALEPRFPSSQVLLVFRVREFDVLRWTLQDDEVRRDVLAVEPRDLVRMTGEAVRYLSGADERPRPPAVLGKLYDILLSDALAARTPDRLLVLADGCLTRLPIDAMSTRRERYEPLARQTNVVYAPYLRDGEAARDWDSSLIVANPNVSARTRRELVLATDLVAAEREARLAADIFPAPRLLQGDAATREAVLTTLSSANVLYFATHAVFHPSAPFASFIPLAGEEVDDAARTILDAGDVRGADLHACDLVILSACGSGAPYVEGGVRVPSLADAFLDAGARTVVHTFWSVADQEARDFMGLFLQELDADASHVDVALWKAKRAWLASETRPAHPRYWSVYALSTSMIPD